MHWLKLLILPQGSLYIHSVPCHRWHNNISWPVPPYLFVGINRGVFRSYLLPGVLFNLLRAQRQSGPLCISQLHLFLVHQEFPVIEYQKSAVVQEEVTSHSKCSLSKHSQCSDVQLWLQTTGHRLQTDKSHLKSCHEEEVTWLHFSNYAYIVLVSEFSSFIFKLSWKLFSQYLVTFWFNVDADLVYNSLCCRSGEDKWHNC